MSGKKRAPVYIFHSTMEEVSFFKTLGEAEDEIRLQVESGGADSGEELIIFQEVKRFRVKHIPAQHIAEKIYP